MYYIITLPVVKLHRIVDVFTSHLTESLNFQMEGKEIISVLVLIKVLILTTLQNARVPSSVRGFPITREYNTHNDSCD